MAKEETRENIIQAAVELFATKGYTDSTTRMIADMAGVNEITIFRHFGNKEKLFSEATKYYVQKVNFLERITDFYIFPIDDAIRNISNEYVNYSFGNLSLFKITLKMHDDMESEYKLRLTKEYSKGLKIYLDYIKSKGIILGDTELIATTHLASLLGLFTLHTLRNDSSEKQIKIMAKLLIENFISIYQLY